MTQDFGKSQRPRKGHRKLLFIDVKRAYFYAKAIRNVYIKLPDEDRQDGKVGKLAKSMYGTRDAASNWEAQYVEFCRSAGLTPGVSSVCAFYNEERDLRAVVHGDDFTYLGYEEDLQWIIDKMKQTFEIKIRGILGPQPGDQKVIRILNRIVTWRDNEIWYECDPRHSEIIVRDLGLANSTSVISSPQSKNLSEEELNEEELSPSDATCYRRITARANFMAQDRPDIQFTVKCLGSFMAKPTKGAWARLKRLGMLLKNYPRYIIKYRWQKTGYILNAFTDSDWAGDIVSRKSTSGGMVNLGDHTLKSWASTQHVVALSSGEAEFYSLVKCISVSIGVRSLMHDLGVETQVRAFTDATTSRSIAHRRGVGKVRHLDTGSLWIQEFVRNGVVEVNKIKNDFNSADLYTKSLARAEIDRNMSLMGHSYESGRSEIAPELNHLDCNNMIVM